MMSSISQSALAVQQALLKRGLETPLCSDDLLLPQRQSQIEWHMQQIMQLLRLDLQDDSLAETPKRIAKMYLQEIFAGLDYENFPKITLISNKMQVDEMVTVSDINVTSICEHHFVTIDGLATISYIPAEYIIGLSKINRIVRFFSQRPQVQERLTQQILVALQTLLQTDNVAVSMCCTHYCVKARGVKDVNSRTTTTALGGIFKTHPITRQEFLQSCR